MYVSAPTTGETVVILTSNQIFKQRSNKTSKRMEGRMQPPTGAGSRKRQSLTLDLNTATAKRNKVQSLLTSPDVQMLKLTSPELEKFLIQNPSLATPTPNGYVFPKSVTEEQINYAKGFEEALAQMQQADSSTTGVSDASSRVAAAATLAGMGNVAIAHSQALASASATSAAAAAAAAATASATPASEPSAANAAQIDNLPLSLPTSHPPTSRPSSAASGSIDSVQIKDEPDDQSLSGGEYSNLASPPSTTNSTTGGVSPIDMDTQEIIKLERKRMRNRLAASKCRKRKLERISQLDDRVKQLKTENIDLAAVVKKMKASVALLKQEVIEHVNSGCEIRMTESTSFS